MKRVNNFYFYQLGASIKPLMGYDQNTPFDWSTIASCYNAKNSLDTFLLGSVIPFRISSGSARALLDSINKVVPDNANFWSEDGASEVNGKPLSYEGILIGNAAREFQTVLSAELENSDTYYVSQKGIFNTSDLIEAAIDAFPEKIRDQLPEDTVLDIKQAGRCLAFELPTACGFHLMRALEAVMHLYYERITEGDKLRLKPAERNWAHYIKKLGEVGASEHVTTVLDHIRSLHRNPLIHPEDKLSPDEALTLWGIVTSATVAMYNDMHPRIPIASAIPAVDNIKKSSKKEGAIPVKV